MSKRTNRLAKQQQDTKVGYHEGQNTDNNKVRDQDPQHTNSNEMIKDGTTQSSSLARLLNPVEKTTPNTLTSEMNNTESTSTPPQKASTSSSSSDAQTMTMKKEATKKRRRKRYNDVDRYFYCDFPNCDKSYGSLTHLNEHRVIQNHGPRKKFDDFKEVKDLIAFKKLQQRILNHETVILGAPEDIAMLPTSAPQWSSQNQNQVFLMPQQSSENQVYYVPYRASTLPSEFPPGENRPEQFSPSQPLSHAHPSQIPPHVQSQIHGQAPIVSPQYFYPYYPHAQAQPSVRGSPSLVHPQPCFPQHYSVGIPVALPTPMHRSEGSSDQPVTILPSLKSIIGEAVKSNEEEDEEEEEEEEEVDK